MCTEKKKHPFTIYVYVLCLSWCLFACLSVCIQETEKLLKPIGRNFFYVTSPYPREVLLMIKFSKICLLQNLSFENLENQRIFYKSARFCFIFVLQCTQREHVHNGN